MLAMTTDTARALDAPAHATINRSALVRSGAPVETPKPRRRSRPGRPERSDRPRRDTRFRAGNRAWTTRRSSGRRRRFADADALETACCAYFAWSDAHPLIHLEPVVWRGELTMLLEVPRLRPFSIGRMCRHLEIGAQTWRDYRRRPDFSEVCGWVECAIYAQQYEGAAAGLFDSRIIRRALAVGAFR